MFDRKAYMKVYHKTWYKKHKMQLLKKFKKYLNRNKKQITKYKAKWYQQNAKRIANVIKKKHLKNPLQRRAKVLKGLYGITLKEYNNLKVAQNNRCKLCLFRPTTYPLHVDHDHRTGKLRGLLCRNCNFALGLFNDDVIRLSLAVKYLKRTL